MYNLEYLKYPLLFLNILRDAINKIINCNILYSLFLKNSQDSRSWRHNKIVQHSHNKVVTKTNEAVSRRRLVNEWYNCSSSKRTCTCRAQRNQIFTLLSLKYHLVNLWQCFLFAACSVYVIFSFRSNCISEGSISSLAPTRFKGGGPIPGWGDSAVTYIQHPSLCHNVIYKAHHSTLKGKNNYGCDIMQL